MKPRFSIFAACLVVAELATSVTYGTSRTWTGTTDATWVTTGNWGGLSAPGAINASSNDVATFNIALVGGTRGGASDPVVIDLTRSIGGITFDTAAVGSYQIGTNAGNQLQLTALTSAANLTQITTLVTSAQVIAAPIFLRNGSGSANPTYTFRNNAIDAAATLTLSGTQTWNGSASRPTFVILDGSNTGTNTISGNISDPAFSQGGAQLTKNGTGTWILSGSNTFTGTVSTGIVINGGILAAYNANALGSGANSNKVAINSTGTLQLGNSITLVDTQRLNLNQGGTIQSSGSTTTNAVVAVNTAATSVTLSTVGSGDVFTIGNGANDFTGGTAGTTVTNISGPGTILLSQAANYAGNFSINAGTLRAGNATALGTASNVVGFGASSTGKLQLNGNSITVGGIFSNAIPGSPVIENGVAGTSTLTVSGVGSHTYAGILQDGAAGTLALTRSGSGVLNLTGSNTYTGATTISGGILRVNNASGSATGTGAVAVNATGTLGGAGFITGAVTVASGGIVAPGNSVGTLTVGGLTLSSGSILNYEFNTSPANDYTVVTGTNGLVINGGGFNLYDEGTLNAFSTVNTYNLIGYAGTIGGTGVTALSVLNPQVGKAYTFGDTGSVVTLGVALSGLISDWNVDASGSWNTAGNWSAAIPNGLGETANFNEPLTAARTVDLDGSKTLGGISFDGGASPLGYTIAPGSGGTLAIDNGVSQANIIVLSGTHAISADVSLDSANTVASVATGTSLEISGSVGGIGNFVKSGGGLLDLTNASNGYDGNTTVAGGTLGFAALGSLGDGNLTIDGGTLRYNAANTADISTKTVTFGIGGAAIDTNGNDVTLANAIGNSGAGSLTKAGTGVLSLNGTNTYTGGTVINSGTVAINNAAGLGAAGGAVTINNGTLQTTADLTSTRDVVVNNANSGFSVDATTTHTVSGVVSGGGTLNKSGNGILSLGGANTFSGGYTVNAGTLNFSNANATGSNTINIAGGAAVTLSDTAGDAVGPLNFTSGTGNFSSSNANGNYVTTGVASAASGATGNINIAGRANIVGGSGSGTLNLTVGNINGQGDPRYDITGSWTAFTGTLNFTATSASSGVRLFANGGGGSAFNGDLSNATVNISGTSGNSMAVSGRFFTNGTMSIGALSGDAGAILQTASASGAGTFSIGAKNQNTIYAGVIQNGASALSITKVGTGTLTLDGTNTYTGATIISGGALQIGNGGSLGTLGTAAVTNNATLAFNRSDAISIGNAITGSGSVVQLGTGQTTLSATNSVGSLITRFGETVVSGSTTATNYVSVGSTNGDSGTLTVQTGGALIATSGAGDVNVGDNHGSTGILNLTGGSITSTNLSIGKNFDNVAATTTTGTVNQSGSSTFTVNGGNGVILANNTGGVGTYNLNGGTLVAKKVSQGAGASGTFNFNGGTLQAGGANATFMTGLTAANVQAGGANINDGGFAVTIGQNLIHDPALGVTPDGGLTKSGAGTLALTGTNTYTGGTIVNAGILAVNGSITSSVTVNSGGTLGGSGTITGDLAVSGGGKLAAGNSPGVLTVSGTTTLGSGSIFSWDLDTTLSGRGTAYDGVNTSAVSGTDAIFQVVLQGTESFDDAFWTTTHTWSDIFTTDGSTPVSSDLATVFSSFTYANGSGALGTPSASIGSFTLTGSTLSWSAVPEPTSALAGLLLGAGLLRRRRSSVAGV